jgi:Arc/MetJ-type ribon-helix-helix transcriptional regulator
MRISLTRALIGLVEKELQGTEAQTATEAVRDGVRLLKDRSARRDFVLSRIRKEFEAVGEDKPRQAAPANVKKDRAEG